MVLAVTVIVVLLAIAIAISATIAVRAWRIPGRLSAPGQARGLTGSASPLAGPDSPTFVIRDNPGFTVRSRTGPAPGPPPTATGGGKPATAKSTGFTYVEVNQNMNAICRLKGRPVGECGCDLHKSDQRKGRPA